MRMAKYPKFDLFAFEAYLLGQVRRESARDRTPSMPWVDRTNIQRGAPVREDHELDIRFFMVCDLSVQPGKVPLMGLVVHADMPVTGMEKVIEPEAGRHFIFRRDGRKEAAPQDDKLRVWQPVDCTVEQDKLS